MDPCSTELKLEDSLSCLGDAQSNIYILLPEFSPLRCWLITEWEGGMIGFCLRQLRNLGSVPPYPKVSPQVVYWEVLSSYSRPLCLSMSCLLSMGKCPSCQQLQFTSLGCSLSLDWLFLNKLLSVIQRIFYLCLARVLV